MSEAYLVPVLSFKRLSNIFSSNRFDPFFFYITTLKGKKT